MKNKLFYFIVLSIIYILVYLILFSEAGYFRYKERLILKENLEREINSLTKENQILEDKLFNENFQEEKYKIVLFKFEQEENSKEIVENQINLNTSFPEKKQFLFLYFFFVGVGYISLFVFFK